MTLYRKQPLEVEAVRWMGDNLEEVQVFAGTRETTDAVEVPAFNGIGTFITQDDPKYTAELWVAANQSVLPVETGEWILKDALGFYPCKDAAFTQSYAEVKEIDENSDFPVIGPECFANKDFTVISYKGANYYQACDAFVSDIPEGGQTHCVKRVNHPGLIHEDYDGNTHADTGAEIGEVHL